MMGSYSSLVYCLNRRRFKNEGIPRTESGGTGGKRIGFSSELQKELVQWEQMEKN